MLCNGPTHTLEIIRRLIDSNKEHIWILCILLLEIDEFPYQRATTLRGVVVTIHAREASCLFAHFPSLDSNLDIRLLASFCCSSDMRVLLLFCSPVACCVVASTGRSVRTLLSSVPRRYIVAIISKAGLAAASCSSSTRPSCCATLSVSSPSAHSTLCPEYSCCFDVVPAYNNLEDSLDHPEFRPFLVGQAEALLPLSASSLQVYLVFHRTPACL